MNVEEVNHHPLPVLVSIPGINHIYRFINILRHHYFFDVATISASTISTYPIGYVLIDLPNSCKVPTASYTLLTYAV